MSGKQWTILGIDVETTGANPAIDRVLEIGTITLDQTLAHIDDWTALVNPGYPISEEATRVHGLSQTDVENAPTFEFNVPFLAGMIMDADALLGYNALEFDIPLLNAEFDYAGSTFQVNPKRVIDPLVFVRWHLRAVKDRSLGAICEHFAVPMRQAHRAYSDISATADLLREMQKRGLIPQGTERILEAQHEFSRLIQAEQARWAYWLYTDREDRKTVRMGEGKHIGQSLDSVPTSYLSYICGMTDLNPGAKAAFEAEIKRRT